MEAKPDNFDKFEAENHPYLKKLHNFSKDSGSIILLADGNPDFKPYDIIDGSLEWSSLKLSFFQDYEPYIRMADAYWFSYAKLDSGGKMWIDANERAIKKAFGKNYIEAIERSRAEKFEI